MTIQSAAPSSLRGLGGDEFVGDLVDDGVHVEALGYIADGADEQAAAGGVRVRSRRRGRGRG